ncbi:hypothetical protein AB9T88_02685 [Flavobacterium sp. LBUM151]
MKNKLLYFLIASIVFIFASCTNDENSHDTILMLPKTITSKDGNNNIYQTTTFTYDENKIISISSENGLIEFEYNGNQIVKEIQYTKYKGEETKYYEIRYTYSNDKLETCVLTFGSQYQYDGKKYIYSYNEDGTVTKATYKTDKKTGKQLENYSTLKFENGNLIKTILNAENGQCLSTSQYDYDANKNAFKNILGLNLLLDQADFGSELNFSSANNINKYHLLSNPEIGIIPCEPIFDTMDYEYNQQGYPIKQIRYDYKGDVKEIIEYTY